MYVYLIAFPLHWGFSGPMKQTTEMNSTGQESQLAGGRPVDYIQMQQRSWTRDYVKQIYLVVTEGLELTISRFHSNH